MSTQILFSKEDPLGTESSVQRLFWHTDYIKNRCRGPNNTWGSNNDIDKAKFILAERRTGKFLIFIFIKQ